MVRRSKSARLPAPPGPTPSCGPGRCPAAVSSTPGSFRLFPRATTRCWRGDLARGRGAHRRGSGHRVPLVVSFGRTAWVLALVGVGGVHDVGPVHPQEGDAHAAGVVPDARRALGCPERAALEDPSGLSRGRPRRRRGRRPRRSAAPMPAGRWSASSTTAATPGPRLPRRRRSAWNRHRSRASGRASHDARSRSVSAEPDVQETQLHGAPSVGRLTA